MTNNPMKRIAFLDYVRVFACFLVMVVHASENFYPGPGATDMAGPQSYLASEADRLWVSVYDGFSRMAVPLHFLSAIATQPLFIFYENFHPAVLRMTLGRVVCVAGSVRAIPAYGKTGRLNAFMQKVVQDGKRA